jgi:hypothetical protein
MNARVVRALCCLAAWSLIAPASAADADGTAVVVVVRPGADAMLGARIERDLRNMYDAASRAGKKVFPVRAIEPRFDVGRLSKADLETARRHFNDAQRALEKGDPDEANEQLFRAERFYNKGVPYASDTALLRGIYYYYAQAKLASGDKAGASEAYCAYVALSRNLAGSAGPMEQFEPLADKCGSSSVAGTAELRVTSEVDGAHVLVDDRPVGVIGRDVAYVDPFLPAGPHLIEVRKVGYARWGTLVNLKNGASESLRAKPAEAKNRREEFDPLGEVVFSGPDASSEDYINDLMFQTAQRYGVRTLVVGWLDAPAAAGSSGLMLLTFSDGAADQRGYQIPPGVDSHRPTLSQYWQGRYGAAVDPATAEPVADRFAPTLFKVE